MVLNGKEEIPCFLTNEMLEVSHFKAVSDSLMIVVMSCNPDNCLFLEL